MKLTSSKFKTDPLIAAITINLVILLGGGAYALFTSNALLLIPLLFVLALINIFLYSSIGSSSIKDGLEGEFIRLFTYFGIFMENGLPVYSALKGAKVFTSPQLEGEVDNLLEAIDNDKSIRPYVEFASLFNNIAIRQVMLSVYQMVEEGYSETYARQFHSLFDSLCAQVRKDQVLSYEGRLNSLCLSSLVGSAITIALLAVAIVSMIGGLINGI